MNIDKDIEKVNKLWYLLDDVYSTGLVEDEERNEYQQAISNVLSEFQALREFSAADVINNADLQVELETYKKIAKKLAEHIDFCPNNFEITKCEDYDNNCAKCRLEYARKEVNNEK